MKKVKLRIVELRHRKNVTQQQLAEYVGVSFQTISKWEKGASIPDIERILALSQLLGTAQTIFKKMSWKMNFN